MIVLGEVTLPGSSEVAAYVSSGHALVNGQAVLSTSSKFEIGVTGSDTELAEWTESLRALDDVIEVRVERVTAAPASAGGSAAAARTTEEFSFELESSLSSDALVAALQPYVSGLKLHDVEVIHTADADGAAIVRVSWQRAGDMYAKAELVGEVLDLLGAGR